MQAINDWMRWYKEVIDRTPETYTYPDPTNHIGGLTSIGFVV